MRHNPHLSNMPSLLSRFIKSRLLGAAPKTVSAELVRTLIEARQFEEAAQRIPELDEHVPDREATIASLEGELAFHQRNDQLAQEAFERSLKLQPSLPDSHYGLSLIYAESGDMQQAVRHAQFAASARPSVPRYQAQLGYCHLSLQNIHTAETPLRTATRLAPDIPFAWNNLGIVCAAQGHWEEASSHFRRALDLKPDFESANIHLQQALLKTESGREVDDAPIQSPLIIKAEIEAHELLCLKFSEEAEAHIRLLELYEKAGDPQNGIEALEIWLSQHPGNEAAMRALGLAYTRADAFSKSEEYLSAICKDDCSDLEIIGSLAVCLAKQDRFSEAAPYFARVSQIAPEDTKWLGMRAANMSNLCDYEEALEICEKIKSLGSQAHCHGAILSYMGHFEEAMQHLDVALTHHPNDANSRMHRAAINLLQEKYGEGWDDYIYRTLANSNEVRVLPFPQWKGEPLKGKKIVVLAEQGLGDQVMFSSCLPDLEREGPAEIVVECIHRVAKTLARSFPRYRFIPTDQSHKIEWLKQIPDMDYFVHLGDLPYHYRRTLSEFPNQEGFLRAAVDRKAFWHEKIIQHESMSASATSRKPRIGISWKGGLPKTRSVIRTMALSQLDQLHRAVDATWVCVQYGNVDQDLAEAKIRGIDLAYWKESIADLDEFAALLCNLDLIITVCNTTVHYAGALHRPVWIMSPKVPEWRYGLHTTTMPWYPSSRIFRQSEHGDWDPVIARMADDLRYWAVDKKCQPPKP